MSRVESVVIIGAGIAGLSLAAELRRRGKDPLLLDRSRTGPCESTARSAWMIRTDAEDPAVEALALRGGARWREGSPAFHATGGFLVDREGSDDLSLRLPGATGRGTWRASDGLVDPSLALLALAPPEDRILRGWSVEGVVPDAVQAASSLIVRGPRGERRARVVVNAAGAWAGRLGRLPLRALSRHLALAAGRPLPADAPYAWDLESAFYLRPQDGGVLLCACDERETEPGHSTVDDETVSGILAAARRLQPGLGPFRLRAAWSGQRAFAPDRRLVVGWDRRTPGLFHLAGLGGHGVTLAPALARLAADALLAGPGSRLPDLLLPHAADRLITA